MEDMVANHYKDVTQVMERLKEQNLVCSPEKSKFFQLDVESCGHILKDGQRFPGPGKLISLQKWEIPTTITR